MGRASKGVRGLSSYWLGELAPAVGHKQQQQAEDVHQAGANQIPHLPGLGRGLGGGTDQ